MYNAVVRLHKEGLSYSQIIEGIKRDYPVRLYRSHVGDWVGGKHSPLGSVNKFDPKPSVALSSVISTMLSDGDLTLHGDYAYGLRLRVKDYEYAYEFGRCLAKVLGRKKPYEPRWSQSARCWVVEGRSVLLYEFLDRPFEVLKPYVEHCGACVAAFLRLFFDGEGSITGRHLTVYNTDKELLLYVQKLLRQYFRIEATGPHKDNRNGRLIRAPTNGKIYRSKKQCWYLYVRTGSLPIYSRYVGFSVRRRQRMLAEAVRNSSFTLCVKPRR